MFCFLFPFTLLATEWKFRKKNKDINSKELPDKLNEQAVPSSNHGIEKWYLWWIRSEFAGFSQDCRISLFTFDQNSSLSSCFAIFYFIHIFIYHFCKILNHWTIKVLEVVGAIIHIFSTSSNNVASRIYPRLSGIELI